jgi:parvulin-like peptidyl-prolyl isomerase
MKRVLIFVFLLVLNAGVFFSSQEIVEEIIAIVNDDVITRSEYEANLRALYQAMRSQLEGEELNKQYNLMKENLLDNMIRNMLLLQEAKEKGFDVTEQVNLYIENIKKENNIETDSQLRQELRKQGMDFEPWRADLEENFLKQALIYSEVDRYIVTDDSEIVSYYKLHPEEFIEPEEYRLRVIYLSTEGQSEEELQSKKEEISRRISEGEEMADLAAQYSEGPEKESQGDLGSFKKGELAKTLEEAVEKLNPGEIHPWLEARNSWYLLKLEEKKESRIKTFEEVKQEIEQKIFSQSKRKKTEEFIKKLLESNYIKILNRPSGS